MESGRWVVWRVRFQVRIKAVGGREGWGSPEVTQVLGDDDGLGVATSLRDHLQGSRVAHDEGELEIIEFRLLSVRPVSVVHLK